MQPNTFVQKKVKEMPIGKGYLLGYNFFLSVHSLSTIFILCHYVVSINECVYTGGFVVNYTDTDGYNIVICHNRRILTVNNGKI